MTTAVPTSKATCTNGFLLPAIAGGGAASTRNRSRERAVEGLAHPERAQSPGAEAPACRRTDAGLLPFAADRSRRPYRPATPPGVDARPCAIRHPAPAVGPAPPGDGLGPLLVRHRSTRAALVRWTA